MSKITTPIDRSEHISILTGGTRGEIPKLQAFFASLRAHTVRPDQVDVWCAIDVGDTLAAENIAEASKGAPFAVHVVEVQPDLSGGWFFNRLREKCTTNPGIWGILSDKIEVDTLGWDEQVRAEFRKVPDGVLFVHGDDTAHRPEARFGAFGFVGAGWANVTGRLFTEHFPFWFDDVWFNDVANLMNRRVHIPIVIKYSVGKTYHMHNVIFWANFYARLVDERVQEGVALLTAVHRGDRAAAVAALRSSPGHRYIVDWSQKHTKDLANNEVARSRRLSLAVPRPAAEERVMRAEAYAVAHLKKLAAAALRLGNKSSADWILGGVRFCSEEGDRLYREGEAARIAGQIPQVMPVLQELMERFPNFPETYWLGVDTMLGLGDVATARGFLQTGLARMPVEQGLVARRERVGG